MLLGLLGSCDRDELLNIEPYGKVLPETIEDYRLWMNSLDRRAVMFQVDRFMSDDIIVPKGTYASIGFGAQQYQDAVTWEKDFGDEQDVDNEWVTLYKQVYESLMIEEDILEKLSGSEKEVQKIIAELKVHSALAYFALVNLYSVQYDPNTADSDLGVPVHSSASMEVSTPRASVKQVYEEIIRLLDEAIESNAMEESVPEFNFQASQVAAYAVKARVYLQMMEYEKALEAANMALQIYPDLADWNQWPTQGDYPIFFDNPEIILFKNNKTRFDLKDVYLPNEVLNLFDENDLRPDLRFRSNSNGTYINESFGYGSDKQYIGPSVPEMYLIRAECNARLEDGDLEQAINDLNTLRVNRYETGTYVPLKTEDFTDDATTLAFVKDERRRELLDRGTRLFDLKRYNLKDTDKVTITRVVEDENITKVLEANTIYWTVPIGRKTISLAPEIVQSPR